MKLFILITIYCLISSIQSTLGPGDKKTKEKSKIKSKEPEASTPTSQDNTSQLIDDRSVVDRGLINENRIPPKDIIFNHNKYCKQCSTLKNFKNKVLGYVTPWNSKGYDISKVFAKKLDYLSPVWLQIIRKGRKDYQLGGTQEIDKKWMKSVSKNNKNVLFVPRIVFENLKTPDLHALFNDEEELEALAKMLVDKANELNFSGYVLEIYSQLGGHGKTQINHLVTDVVTKLHESKKILILVIPPALKTMNDLKNLDDTNAVFSKQDFYNLKDVVDGFSLMTYDYAINSQQIGPNAPLDWVRANVNYLTDSLEDRSKIFLGLNFYGMKYNVDTEGRPVAQPESIVGNKLVEMLKKNQAEIIFEEKIQEHIFVMKGARTQTLVFYPTLYSIQKRIELSEELGTGISIWELGQGLDYFYDLL